ncbi:MAG TPA: hypothetical protein VFE42_05845 [Chloroflexota bacterium]|nr:hypothetical protein [Chloroflexota bacterium]
MATRTITVTIPEDTYAHIEAQARESDRSVEDLIAQTLARSVSPPIEADLPPLVQAELRAMGDLSEDALSAIARSTANPDKVALYDRLIERRGAGSITAQEQRLLEELSMEADALMLRKAHAYALLQARGQSLPTLAELRRQRP